MPTAPEPPSIDDPSNRWLIHPIAAALVPWAVTRRISANAISMSGLGFGFLAACAYTRWSQPGWAFAGFLMMVGWHICDGMDGMVARATGTSSEAGRLLDGLCDYTSFILVYLVLGATLPWNEPLESYWVALLAGVAHAVQSALYEGSRERYFRRMRGEPATDWQPTSFGGGLEGLYARVNRWAGAATRTVDRAMADPAVAVTLRPLYSRTAVPWLRFLTLLGANGRTLAIFLACLAGSPVWFWWWEVIVLTPVTIIGLARLRAIDRRLARHVPSPPHGAYPA